jgi:hypothetical protein
MYLPCKPTRKVRNFCLLPVSNVTHRGVSADQDWTNELQMPVARLSYLSGHLIETIAPGQLGAPN